ARQRSGNAGARSTGQRQGSSANPSTGQIGPTFEAYFGLSIPAVVAGIAVSVHIEVGAIEIAGRQLLP
ncbi:hypothetical protein, partial [Paraburkholderia sp. BR14320]|uniref:hypothetical protein n=1 Tax=unclassified Paraburkholderia TaxID=2615204 RepID=UPI0034D017DB